MPAKTKTIHLGVDGLPISPPTKEMQQQAAIKQEVSEQIKEFLDQATIVQQVLSGLESSTSFARKMRDWLMDEIASEISMSELANHMACDAQEIMESDIFINNVVSNRRFSSLLTKAAEEHVHSLDLNDRIVDTVAEATANIVNEIKELVMTEIVAAITNRSDV